LKVFFWLFLYIFWIFCNIKNERSKQTLKNFNQLLDTTIFENCTYDSFKDITKYFRGLIRFYLKLIHLKISFETIFYEHRCIMTWIHWFFLFHLLFFLPFRFNCLTIFFLLRCLYLFNYKFIFHFPINMVIHSLFPLKILLSLIRLKKNELVKSKKAHNLS
jgi:uncharacterized membrane protein YciS (DUF1049 family)